MPTFREFMRVADLTIKDKTSGKRMGEIRAILKKHDAFHHLTPEKAVAILEDLGPTYVKMGQIASNRSDVLPKEYCDAFEKLRANVPPVPFDQVIATIERSYGASWSQVFASIEERPLGSASIAQVHKATLLDGTSVAVKVRRPGIVQQMAEDILLMKHLLALAEFSTSQHEGIMLTLDGLVAELERTTADELDFTVELENLVRFYGEVQGQPGVTSPVPYPRHTTEDVLVMEFVTGVLVNDKERLTASGVDLSALGERLAQSYVTQVVDDGFFHADPHPGNIVVREGEIVWIDLGMTGTLTASERALVSSVFQAVATKNAYELKGALLSLAKAKGPVDHGLLLDQMSALLASYGSADLADINIGTAFLDLIEVLRSQNLVLSPAFTMLARGFLTLEGVLADLAPSINVVDIVSKHVEGQVKNFAHVERKAKELLGSTAESAEALTRLPSQLSNTLDMLDRGQLKVSAGLGVPDSMLATLYAISGRIALAMISAGLFIGSSVLCTTNMEPRILEVPLLGALGYVGAFVLGVYVIWRTLVTRHQQRNDERLG